VQKVTKQMAEGGDLYQAVQTLTSSLTGASSPSAITRP
jgi:hypothetical protein